MREQLLKAFADVRRLVLEARDARRAGIAGVEGEKELEVIAHEIDEAMTALRTGALPPSSDRMDRTARFISDWFPRTELGERIADVWNDYQHAK